MALSTAASSTKRRRVVGKLSPFYIELLAEVGSEGADPNQQVYLVTVSRALPGAIAAGLRGVQTLSRQELREMVRDAFDNPVGTLIAVGGDGSWWRWRL